jgi:IgGFc binding protein/CHU_C Type IX secretion signal domain/PKD domain
MNYKKMITTLAVVALFSIKSFSQFTATWAFTSSTTTTGVKAGTQQANITIGNAIVGSAFNTPTYSGSGIKCQPPSADWPTVATDGWNIDFPISPVVGQDATLVGLTFTAKTSGSSGTNIMGLAYQADGVGVYIPFGTPQSTGSSSASYSINFGTLNRNLYSGHTYKIRLYIYAAATGMSSGRSVSILNTVYTGTTAIAGTQPTIATTSATTTGKYTATATGVLTAGTYTITESGVVWDIAANPIVALTTKNNGGPTTSGNINLANGGSITGLTAGTTYFARAYVISETGDVFYGVDKSFTTDVPSIASLTTNPATNFTSIKATSGGIITDSGGVSITAKGVCWSTTNNPTTADAKTIDGVGNANFSSTLKILNPNTTYYARAYATNSIGTAYGNEVSFTTLVAEPVIITTTANGQNTLPFGNIIVNNTSAVQFYTLIANALTPTGSITITAPTGFQVSTNASAGFASSINVAYTGNNIAAMPIYVRFTPNFFGDFTGAITHTGGNANALLGNVDSVMISGKGIQNAADFSNTGTDFWVGYATHQLMYNSDGITLQSNGGDQAMKLYLSNQNNQDTKVYISIPGLNFYDSVNVVTANSVYEYTVPDKIGTQYAQLFQEGKFAKAIHITSIAPIVVYAHIYGNQVSGASLLLPTNTWGIDYYATSYNQNTASSSGKGAYNYFFVIANEDNTNIEITPTVNTLGGWSANPAVPYAVTLNKGEIYNVLATKIGNEDVTGSRIKSLDCSKKIAVFSGSGRTGIQGNCNTALSSDNLFAQVFPSAAWGTKYLTTPTIGTTGENIYRVFVKDIATVVTVNGSALLPANLINNFYYEIKTVDALKIEANKPVSVTQYTTSVQGCTNVGGNISGDPEMIFISPIQQAIDKATFFSPSNQDIAAHYLNVIIPKDGIDSFKLDNVNKAAKFTPHPQDATFYTASFDIADGMITGQHSISSNYPFTAIAYGYADANTGGSSNARRESYGYNAGTYIKPQQYLSVQNQYPNTSGDTIIPACINNDFTYKIFLPNKPLSINWNFLNNSAQLPNANSVLINNPTPVDSVIINGILQYKYILPTVYKFNAIGSFPINITVNATNADGCTGLQTIAFNVKVVAPPVSYFTQFPTDICALSSFINFPDSSYDVNGYKIIDWNWSVSPGTETSNTNSFGLFPKAEGTYNVSLRAINSIGCYKDTTIPFIIKPLPKIDTVIANNNGLGCVGQPVIFTTTATTTLGSIAKYYWDFGDGKKDTTTTKTVSHIYTTQNVAGYIVKVLVQSSAGCPSAYFTTTQSIHQVVANFSFVSPQCINTPITFTDLSTGINVLAPVTANWKWSFGDALNTTATTPNTAMFTYNAAGTFAIKLRVALTAGANEFCVDDSSKTIVINSLLIKPIVTVNNTATTTNSLTYKWDAIVGATGYQVSFNGGSWITPSSGTTGLTHTATGLSHSTVYTLCVKALGTCPSDSACVTAKTTVPNADIFVPNVFTPNGQGPNEKLILCSNNIKTIKFSVYSQWGEKLYETTNPHQSATQSDCVEVWDGTAFGKPQPVGVYAYIVSIIFNDNKTLNKKGLFNLLR